MLRTHTKKKKKRQVEYIKTENLFRAQSGKNKMKWKTYTI